MLFVSWYVVDVSLGICIIKKRSSKLAAVILQSRQKKKRERNTYDFLSMNSSLPSPPCSVVKRCHLGSLSDFRLCEGEDGAN